MVAKLADCHAETKRKMEEEKKGWLVFAANTFIPLAWKLLLVTIVSDGCKDGCTLSWDKNISIGENQSLLLCRDLDCCVYSVHGCCVAERCCMLHKLNAFCWYMQFVVCCMVHGCCLVVCREIWRVTSSALAEKSSDTPLLSRSRHQHFYRRNIT